MNPRGRRILLVAALLSLGLGVLAGLARLGFAAPPSLGPWHGVLMSIAFMGLLISLERAVALEQTWGYGPPWLILAGTLGLLWGWEGAPWIYVLAGPWALAVQLKLVLRRPNAAGWVMAAGTLAWALGLGLWAAQGDFVVTVLCWAAFPVLVIAGERLELAFAVRPRALAWWFFLAGVSATLAGPFQPVFAAVGWLALSLWMLRHDVLSRGASRGGFPRYQAVALGLGYAWLAVAAVCLWFWTRGDAAYWDAALHALFLGFMFAMIFAHAPVIFPAVAGVDLVWHRGHYLHLVAMSLAVALRVAAAPLGSFGLKRGASLAAAWILLIFLLNQLQSVRLARRSSR
jgi:hypothetical protein